MNDFTVALIHQRAAGYGGVLSGSVSGRVFLTHGRPPRDMAVLIASVKVDFFC